MIGLGERVGLLWCLLAALLIGCNSPDTNTVGASGVVTYAGATIEGAEVAFLPKDTMSDAKPARGTTDASGEFVVKTYFNSELDAKGVRPGDYMVTIKKMAAPEGMTLDEWQLARMDDLTSVPPLRYLLPEVYGNVKTTTLTATIENGGKNRFEFNLE